MDLVLVLIFVLTILALLWPVIKGFKGEREFKKLINALPGPTTYPFFGTTLAYIFTPREGKLFVPGNF